MKKLLYILLTVLFFLGIGVFSLEQYLNSGVKGPDNSMWVMYMGKDTTTGLWPDTYANYITYTYIRTRDNIGLRIKGEFPDARYMSFNVYDLSDKSTQGSFVDHQLTTDSGLPNPFLEDSAKAGKHYTMHIVPETYAGLNLRNTLTFRDDSRAFLVVIRLYDMGIEPFGGVEYPTVEAIDLRKNKDGVYATVNLPKAFNLRSLVDAKKLSRKMHFMYQTEELAPHVNKDMEGRNMYGLSMAKDYAKIPFHTVDPRGYIENNDNKYTISALTKRENEVYVIRFKAPQYTTSAENLLSSDVRYWSVNLGNHLSYNFNGIKDEDCRIDENGYVTIVLADEDTILQTRIQELGFNFLAWNMPHKKGLLVVRNMLTRPGFVGDFDKIPPALESTTAFEELEAYRHIGEYGPKGLRMTKDEFLSEFTLNKMSM